VAALACTLSLNACGGSDAAATPEFSFKSRVVAADIAQETLPYAGIVAVANINERGRDESSQRLYPFVGFESSFGAGHSKVGNAAIGSTARLLARLYPNLGLIPAGAEVKVYPMAVRNLRHFHCLKANERGGLGLSEVTRDKNDLSITELAACASATLAATDAKQALELAIDMRLDHSEGLLWVFAMQPAPGQWTFISASTEDLLPPQQDRLTYTTAALAALIQFNDLTESALPAKVTAHGGFRPVKDGFGFPNSGDGSFDLYSAEDIARSYGKSTVCFLDGDRCTGLNPLGYFFKNELDQFQEATRGGLCYGHAMAAMALHQKVNLDGKQVPSDYNPQAQSTIELNYRDVRSLIARLYMGQYATTAVRYEDEACADLLPSQVLRMIEDGFNTEDPIAAISFYQLDPETQARVAGHAVTPWAISDEGDGIRRIYVYDNNDPGDAARHITVDTQQETWSFSAKTNASAAEAEFKGQGKVNPMCPRPLSSGLADPSIAVQPVGTTRFIDLSQQNTRVVDAGGRISGADFETQTNINNIEGAELQSLGLGNALVIPVAYASNALPDIDQDNVRAYLNQMYTVNAMSVDEDAEQAFVMNQSALLDPHMTSAYNFAAVMTQVNMSDLITFKAHASARIVTAEDLKATQTQTLALDTFITLNTEQTGYSSQINIDATQVSQDALGFFVKNNGRDVVVFEYDPKDATNTFSVISPERYSLEVTQFNPDGTTELLVSAE
jgi:hypothetical protein